MNRMPGGLTVLMPVYNCSKYLEASVRSVLAQTFVDFEFLIMDDGSTDNPEKVLSRFSDSRINFIRKSHTGLADTLNEGLRLASGNWIARIDSDDIAVSNRLMLQAEYLNSNNDDDVIAGSSVYFSGNGKVKFTVRPPEEDSMIKQMLNVHNPVNHSAVTFRKDKILFGGGYDVNMKCFEDFELWLRLKDKLKFRILPDYLAFTRIRKDSMTAVADYKQIYDILKRNYLNLKESDHDTDYLKELRFRIEFFYGNKDEARRSKPPLDSPARIAAFLSTLLPESSFGKLKNSRLRYRLNLSKQEKKELENELSQYLLNS